MKKRRTAQEVSRQLSNLTQALEARKKELMELTAKEAQYQKCLSACGQHQGESERRLRQADEQEALARRKVGELDLQEARASESLAAMKAQTEETVLQVAVAETTLSRRRARPWATR